jgi:uncharacterized coiled-coil protein SlyX
MAAATPPKRPVTDETTTQENNAPDTQKQLDLVSITLTTHQKQLDDINAAVTDLLTDIGRLTEAVDKLTERVNTPVGTIFQDHYDKEFVTDEDTGRKRFVGLTHDSDLAPYVDTNGVVVRDPNIEKAR